MFPGAGYLEPLIVETLTRTRFETFMSRSKWALAWDLARLRLAGWLPPRGAPQARGGLA